MSPFYSMVRSALPIAVIGFGLSIAAAVETTLQGWGDYKFGMTPDQTRALPGTSLSKLITPPNGVPLYYMNGLAATRIEGHDFKVVIYFGKDKRLKSIGFTEVGTARPSSECERGFQDLLRSFETRYGLFSPKLPEGDVFGMAVVTWRPLPGSTSKYSVLTPTSNDSFRGIAQRKFGRAWVEVNFETNTKGRCDFDLTFQQD